MNYKIQMIEMNYYFYDVDDKGNPVGSAYREENQNIYVLREWVESDRAWVDVDSVNYYDYDDAVKALERLEEENG